MGIRNELSVIECLMDNNVFVRKHPQQDFNSGSILIVRENQEALFFMNGKALDLFGPGRHELITQNLPLLSVFFSRLFGGKSTFRSELYFVNTTDHLGIKWGTDSRLEYTDPQYGFPVSLGARGELGLRVVDARRLIIKFVGNEYELTNSQFEQKIKVLIIPYIKQTIARYIISNRISIFDVDLHLLEISKEIQNAISLITADYGIELTRFVISGIVKPEDDVEYKRFKELKFRQVTDIGLSDIEAKKNIINAQGIAEKRRIEGYTYDSERKYNIAQAFAENKVGASGIANLGVELGAMMGIGIPISKVISNTISDTLDSSPHDPSKVVCSKCGALNKNGSKFCISCGEKIKQTVLCPNCGVECPQSAKFCPNCGCKVNKGK